jgi:hypothetical protein
MTHTTTPSTAVEVSRRIADGREEVEGTLLPPPAGHGPERTASAMGYELQQSSNCCAENCRTCGEPLQQHTGRGRPNRYCSTSCKWEAAYELRNADPLLQLAELKLSTDIAWDGKREREVVDFWTAEVQRLEQRRRQLLKESNDKNP